MINFKFLNVVERFTRTEASLETNVCPFFEEQTYHYLQLRTRNVDRPGNSVCCVPPGDSKYNKDGDARRKF